jgi:PHD/YefM family antitoxin component YafN of YafNO toxin-antitoxin module
VTIPLSDTQLRALDLAGTDALQLVDPRTNAAYVLVRAEDYESVQEVLEDTRQQQAIRAVAMRNAARRTHEQGICPRT